MKMGWSRGLCQCAFFWLCGVGVLALSACSGADKAADRQSATVDQGAIAPSDFVVAPCARATVEGDCVVVAAGGKRVLFGAPAGVGVGQIAGDNTPPDGVILFSLQAFEIEGLDEVRNRAWVSGRRSGPLPVVGDTGAERIVTALNEAYITSDALAYIERDRRGGFNEDAMIGRDVRIGDTVFDTGDLVITALAGGSGKLAFLVQYEQKTVIVAGCGARAVDVAAWPESDAYVGCRAPNYSAPASGAWPLRERVYIFEETPAE